MRRESQLRRTNRLVHGERLWPAKFEHPIQNVARDQRFSFLRFGMTSTEPVAYLTEAPLTRQTFTPQSQTPSGELLSYLSLLP
jgi:hypothetical protein